VDNIVFSLKFLAGKDHSLNCFVISNSKYTCCKRCCFWKTCSFNSR